DDFQKRSSLLNLQADTQRLHSTSKEPDSGYLTLEYRSSFAAKQNVLQLFLLYGIKNPMLITRYSETSILQDLAEKIVS
ncbi:MAG: hypothetical protein KKH02_07640, partial [Proteobacteria bacterium]|nr:hypothetical protein [Pseudomonadota bacterium]